MTSILVVEDNELSRDMLTRRLQLRGYTVTAVADGTEAVALAPQLQPDIILMDMSLPIMDGWQATRFLKSAAATDRIPVIALTAHAMASDELRCREAGCDGFETKPIDLARLCSTIEGMIWGQHAASAADGGLRK